MSTKTVWKVVQVPTALGIVSGFRALVLAEHDSKANADEHAHLEYADEPSPDKTDYYTIQVIEVLTKVEEKEEDLKTVVIELLKAGQRVVEDQTMWNGKGYPRRPSLIASDNKIMWKSIEGLKKVTEKYRKYNE